MSSGKETRNLFSRFPALTWLGAIFCFVLVPILLINEGLEGTLRLQHESECEHLFQQMNDRLNFISRHADEAHYFHRLFRAMFKRATAAKEPVSDIASSIRQLKQKFPGTMRFIVWDAKGRCVEHLTDEKGYRYIVNNLQSFFREIADHCRANVPGVPEALPIVEKRTALFRSYLGRFLVPAHLRLPFQAGELGRCILADTHERFPLFWFDADESLTVFCMLKPSQQSQNQGIRHAINTLNKEKSPITCGFVDMRQIEKISPRPGPDEQRQLLIELGKFENASLPNRNSKDYLFAFKLLTPDLRGFAMTRKSNMQTGFPKQSKAAIFARLGLLVAIGLFVVFCYTLRFKRLTMSIRSRIALLFIYANGLPLMILGTIGNEYLQQKELSLTQEAHRQNERVLQEVDAGYRRHRLSISRLTQVSLNDFVARVKDRQPNRDDQEALKDIAVKIAADEIAIFNKAGETIINFKKNRKTASQTFIKMFATSALAFANQRATDFSLRDSSSNSQLAATSNSLINENASMLKDLLATMGNVEYYTFGNEQKLCFSYLLGNKQQRDFNSVLIIFWLKEETQAAFASEQLAELSKKSASARFASLAVHNGAISSTNFSQPELLRPYLQKAFNLQSARENNLMINGRRHIVTAIAGRQLANIALGSVIPADFIEHEIEQARWQIMLFAIVSILIVSGVVTTLSRQFLLPVNQLTETVRQIGRRNFTHQCNIQTNDEFGDLGKVFNTTTSEMADLEIGKVVQTALFPGQNYKSSSLTIYAKTASMTKLGGDYYDFFSLENLKTGVFMGDVAGHGIPAALIMAMAKSTVLTNSDKLNDPSALLLSLHQMLFKLKGDGFKRMMTCQYLVFDESNGECCLANAGHCFPVIVGPGGGSSRFEEIIGSPVGIAKRSSYINHKIILQPGETVILYSDGMLEAANQKGEIYGSVRFLELAKQCWHADLQTYYSSLFNANMSWSPSAEDDITIVLIRYQPEVQHG